MKVSTLIHNHFTVQALRKAVKAIAIYNEDGSEVLELTTVLTHESLDHLSSSNKRVVDWNMTSTTFYIYVR